ncbi:MAG: PQQ-dependent sugar dehydrogenase [bacterium]
MKTLPPLAARAWLAAAALLPMLHFFVAPAAGQAVALRRVLADQDLIRPVHLTAAPDGSGRLAVVEQDGRILWFRPQARRAEGVLLDIRDRVSTAGWEEGLLSLAFHPRFGENRELFVYYSAASPRRSVVARFRADAATGRADAAGEERLLQVRQPYANHNGGQIAFGPDGYLYIGLGDGGWAGDPLGNGQNRKTLLGALLRIDVERRQGSLAYAIPPDNPFAKGGGKPEIWAYGLRNPWRFSFDRNTGALYAADVGQGEIEEVDLIVRGGNYGWNRMEGTACYRPPSGCRTPGLLLPIAEYTHALGNSITGGFVYRGRQLPWLRGRYLFGDYGSGTIWSIPAGAGPIRPPRELLATGLSISSFGQDRDGELYVVGREGTIYRLIGKN